MKLKILKNKGDNMKITILTPAYNRAYSLKRLYDSLVNQTKSNFEWLIVDDGSTDNTEELVQNLLSEKKIKIKYIKQKNGGKHRALNKAIKEIKNEMTFIVDSDDYLTSDAIETIDYYYEKYKDTHNLCGYSFLRGYPNGHVNGPKYKEDEYISDYFTCRLNENNWGDKAEVYFTKYLKETPFVEIPGEKFLVESYVWGKLGYKYNTLYVNKIIYIGDYLDDGLTKNRKNVKINSPKGVVEVAKVLCCDKAKLKVRIKFMIFYITYGLFAQEKISNLYFNIKYKILFVLLFPLALIYKKKLEKLKNRG